MSARDEPAREVHQPHVVQGLPVHPRRRPRAAAQQSARHGVVLDGTPDPADGAAEGAGNGRRHGVDTRHHLVLPVARTVPAGPGGCRRGGRVLEGVADGVGRVLRRRGEGVARAVEVGEEAGHPLRLLLRLLLLLRWRRQRPSAGLRGGGLRHGRGDGGGLHRPGAELDRDLLARRPRGPERRRLRRRGGRGGRPLALLLRLHFLLLLPELLARVSRGLLCRTGRFSGGAGGRVRGRFYGGGEAVPHDARRDQDLYGRSPIVLLSIVYLS
mmetsp:Transcript_32400/g.64208  ORF Transcript_32400/g.64208 Transcript_32400/m.64208 type:complete len:270 (+) Transcript_32400:1959-2768(+)